MIGCEVLFGKVVGAQAQAMIEAATGGPCPCVQGLRCPLLPAPESPPLAEPVASGF